MAVRLSFVCLCAALVLAAACTSSRRSGRAAGGEGDATERYMARQAEELAGLDEAHTTIVDNEIRITWEADVLFDFDSAMLRLDSAQKIRPLADVFLRYPDTDIVVTADTPGAPEHAQKLSQRRALSMRQFLVKEGVDASRIEAAGYEDTRPPDNTTGSARIEIRVRPRETVGTGGDNRKPDRTAAGDG